MVFYKAIENWYNRFSNTENDSSTASMGRAELEERDQRKLSLFMKGHLLSHPSLIENCGRDLLTMTSPSLASDLQLSICFLLASSFLLVEFSLF